MDAATERPIGHLDDLAPQWLERRLRARGHLPHGRVAAVRVTSAKDSPATGVIARFTAEYAPGAPGLPSHFFLKIGDPRTCLGEVRFYNRVARRMPAPPIARCFDAVYDDETDRAHVLIEDLSSTHHQGTGQPSLKDVSGRVVDAFARLHAHWWDHGLFGGEVGSFPGADNVLFSHGAESYREKLARFADSQVDLLSAKRLALYERALDSFARFTDLRGRPRLTPGNHLTLIHGDAKYDNVMVPKDPQAHDVLLIDWQTWEIRLGTDDIAGLGLTGFPDPHSPLATDLLRRYHDGLLRHGVEGYGWDDCWHDFRLSTVRNLFIPINAGTWRAIERTLLNFYQLDCPELLV